MEDNYEGKTIDKNGFISSYFQYNALTKKLNYYINDKSLLDVPAQDAIEILDMKLPYIFDNPSPQDFCLIETLKKMTISVLKESKK